MKDTSIVCFGVGLMYSPIRLEHCRRYLPNWLKRFLPSCGGRAEDHHGKAIFGFSVFFGQQAFTLYQTSDKRSPLLWVMSSISA